MIKKLTMFFVCLFLSAGLAYAQTNVTGTVVSSEDGEPVVGATVRVVGSNAGAVTDINGAFSLTLPAGKSQLEVSYVGMVTKTVKASSRMRIELVPDDNVLDEVMVVAYGTAKRSSFTGSAAVVKADEISKVQVTNAVDALKGKASGVQIYTASGQPGTAPSIRIRGVNSINADSDPLIVVDGSPYSGSLNDINPIDVESMTVLKDAASTSLYGARGGNGVILITTKSGKKGSAANITVDAKWGSNSKAVPNYNVINSPAKYYEMWYKSLYNYASDKFGYSAEDAWRFANEHIVAPANRDEYSLGYNVYNVPDGQTLIGHDGKLNPNATLGRVVNYNGTDYLLTPDSWEDEVYNNSLRQEYTVSATGSTDRSNFYLSFNYLDNDGITVASDYKRITSRLKADYQITDWLKVGANANYTHWDRNQLGDDGNSVSSGNAFALINLAPIYPVYIRDKNGNFIYDANSRLNLYDYGDGTINGQYRAYLRQSNPLSANQLDTYNQEGNVMNAVGDVEIRLPLGFTFTSINDVFVREYRYTLTTNPFFGQYASSKGIVSKEHYRNWSYNIQQRLNWRKTFGQHTVEAMAVHEYYRSHGYDLSASKQNQFSPFDNKELHGAVVPGTSDSYTTDYNEEKWIGRAQYDFAERYFVHGSVTRDASSRFHPDKRWGTFWSAGVAWLVNKEKFMEDVSWLDELKFKASYGENGNDQIGSYLYVNYYNIVNSNDNVSLVPASLGNPDISWEKAAKFNAGFEFSLFKGRLYGGIDYYFNKTNNMLSWAPLPATYGYTGYWDNVGNMINQGIEAELHGDIIRTKDLTWSAYANLTTNHNEITTLSEERKKMWYDNIQSYGYSSGAYFYREGSSRYTYYTKRYAGVDPKTGEAMFYKNVYEKEGDKTVYYDKNGNKIADPDNYTEEKRRKIVGEEATTVYGDADDYLCGDMMPDIYGGFGTSLTFRGFDVSVDFTYQLGGKVYDSSYASLMSGNEAGYGMHVDLLNAWSTNNTGSNIPRIQYHDSYTTASSDRWLTSASYLALQNITLGYTLPTSWIGKIGLKKVRFYAVADNIWVWSKRQGLDPRQGISGSNTASYYAPIRTISGGITVTF